MMLAALPTIVQERTGILLLVLALPMLGSAITFLDRCHREAGSFRSPEGRMAARAAVNLFGTGGTLMALHGAFLMGGRHDTLETALLTLAAALGLALHMAWRRGKKDPA